MKNTFRKRFLAAAVGSAVMFSALPASGISAANVEETPAYAASENRITNSTFDSNTDGWSYYAHKDAAAGDLSTDGRLDAFALSMMKKMLMA